MRIFLFTLLLLNTFTECKSQTFSLTNLHKFMANDKSYFARELKAQGLDFISVGPPEYKSDGLMIFIEGGSVSYAYKDSKCSVVMFSIEASASGSALSRDYFDYLNIDGTKLSDGSWVLKYNNTDYRVVFKYDESVKTIQGIYIIKPY